MKKRFVGTFILSVLAVHLLATLFIAWHYNQTKIEQNDLLAQSLAQILGKTEQTEINLQGFQISTLVAFDPGSTVSMAQYTSYDGQDMVVWIVQPRYWVTVWQCLPFSLLYSLPPILMLPVFTNIVFKRLFLFHEHLDLLHNQLGGDKDTWQKEASPELWQFLQALDKEKSKMGNSLERLKRSEKMRREFTANVTHELKTPLTSINGYAEMIESGMVSPEDTRKFAGIIHSEGNKLLELIDEIIQLSKYDDPSLQVLNKDVFSLSRLIQEVVNNLQVYAREHSVSLYTELEDTSLWADRHKISDMLVNLCTNAIKYNKPNGKVKITTRQDDSWIYIVVKDNGIGIPKEYQERVFERFFVVNPARYKSGTGLGLSLVKHIVQQHKGELHMKSHPGKGTRMEIRLPNEMPELIP